MNRFIIKQQSLYSYPRCQDQEVLNLADVYDQNQLW